MEPPGEARHSWANREVERAGAHEPMWATSEFQWRGNAVGPVGRRRQRCPCKRARLGAAISYRLCLARRSFSAGGSPALLPLSTCRFFLPWLAKVSECLTRRSLNERGSVAHHNFHRVL